jgi:hypothetical protein
MGKKDNLTFPLSRTILNLNHTDQIHKYALLCFSHHMAHTAPVFFTEFFETSDPIAIITDQLNALPGHTLR